MYERIDTPRAAPGSLYNYVVERDGAGADSRYTYRFTVVGRGEFPFDMLRRDECYPADPESAENLRSPPLEARRDMREVVLVSHQPRNWWNPTFDRWASFGWRVRSDA